MKWKIYKKLIQPYLIIDTFAFGSNKTGCNSDYFLYQESTLFDVWNDFKSFISPTLRICFIEFLEKPSNHIILLLRNKKIANQTNSVHQLKVYN